MFPDSGQGTEERSRSFDSFARRAGLSAVPAPVLIGVCLVVVIAVAAGAWRALTYRADSQTFAFEGSGEEIEDSGAGEVSAAEEGAAAEGSAMSPAVPATMWVHVAGAVAHPGLYEIAAGGRVGDALGVAGGAVADACVDAVNLARPLTDGERVYVPTRAEIETGGGLGDLVPAEGGPETGGGGARGASRVNLNSANAAELEALPGIGPATATKIISDRESNGPFASPEDLMRVSGIGEKKYEALSDLITVR